MRRLAAASLALVASVSACSSSTDASVSIVGIYSLRTINGQSLPFLLVSDAQGTIEVTNGTVDLRADGTFSDVTTFRVVEGGQETIEVDTGTGTYRRTGNTVTFSLSNGDSYTMVFDGENTLTQQFFGLVLVYRR
jgi:hypothetical protein